MKYVFKHPVTLINAAEADPQKIGEALEKLALANDGNLTPQITVDAAKSPKHVLHRHFLWDDAKAADAYRLDQARALIRSIHAEEESAEDGHVQAFISISDKAGTSYKHLRQIKESVDLQAKVLEQAHRDLEAWKKRYRALADVCRVIEEAQEKLREKLAKQRKREARASA